uniref:Ras-related protein Rab n=1 Tax=Neovison vison TaxID=452646 RepID=A0A8C7C7R3_NEOVI
MKSEHLRSQGDCRIVQNARHHINVGAWQPGDLGSGPTVCRQGHYHPAQAALTLNLLLYLFLGQERFGNMTRVYYKEAVGAFVVFDISRGSTFEAVLKWKSDLDSKVHLPNGSPIPAVLLANKCDQKKDGGQNPPQMDQFCKEHGFTGWFETSAKDNINIDEAARFLVENILANHQSFVNEENDRDRVQLDQDTLTAESKSQCC